MPAREAQPGPGRLQLELPPEPGAPSAARDALRTLPLGDHTEDVLLAASELVTNAVLHGGHHGPIEVIANFAGDQTRVEVRDGGQGFASTPSLDGFGLRILDAASERWGIEQGDRTAVWFEMR